MRVEVKKQINAETNEVWSFNLFDLNAVFVYWHKEVKPKGKRTWKIVEFWDKYGRSKYAMSAEPILPDEIKSEAINQIMQYVKVNTWNEWKAR